jgi:hypothetical protein
MKRRDTSAGAASRPARAVSACPGCDAKDQVIEILREQLASEREGRIAATDKIITMADPMALERIGATRRAARASVADGEKPVPPVEKRRATAVPEKLSDEQLARLASMKATLAIESAEDDVSALPRRDEIEQEFRTPDRAES